MELYCSHNRSLIDSINLIVKSALKHVFFKHSNPLSLQCLSISFNFISLHFILYEDLSTLPLDGVIYSFVEQPMPFEDAENYCQNVYRGHLVTIGSKETQDYVYSEISNRYNYTKCQV